MLPSVLADLLDYEFMRNAYAAAAIVALVSGPVGYFLVLRGQGFAGHALSHVGFTGATGAALLGAPPLAGLVVLTVLCGMGMGAMGEKLAGRDVAIGMVLALALGLGLLFLHYVSAFATQATALLFGNVLGVDGDVLLTLGALGAVSLGGLAAIARPLLFASLQPELAEARGVPVRLVSVLFLGIVGLATAGCAQVVGVLLVFALMVGPAAAAQRVATRLGTGIGLSALLALAEAWGGITLAAATDWPASFCITALSGTAYLIAPLVRPAGRAVRRPGT